MRIKYCQCSVHTVWYVNFKLGFFANNPAHSELEKNKYFHSLCITWKNVCLLLQSFSRSHCVVMWRRGQIKYSFLLFKGLQTPWNPQGRRGSCLAQGKIHCHDKSSQCPSVPERQNLWSLKIFPASFSGDGNPDVNGYNSQLMKACPMYASSALFWYLSQNFSPVAPKIDCIYLRLPCSVYSRCAANLRPSLGQVSQHCQETACAAGTAGGCLDTRESCDKKKR